MAIKASATITLSGVVDVQSTTRYYLLQASTLTPPAKPVTNPPGGAWDDTEPGYTTGSTNTLYFTDLTVFSDGTWAYSAVSVSSAYEAAKAAYNKAAAAQGAVTALDDSLTQQEIFNRLTDGGAAQGVVLYNGQLYINASYINAGALNARYINFNAPADDFDIPDESDPDTLLEGQAVVDGWIVNESGSGSIVALRCRYAKLLRGRTVTLRFTYNGSLNYCEYWWDSLDGESGSGITEPVIAPNPYTYTFVVPDEADVFWLMFDCAGLKQISATVSGAQIVYPDDIRFTYAGLQVGGFLVDRDGNVHANAQSIFGGGVKFSGHVGFENPSSVRNNLGVYSTVEVDAAIAQSIASFHEALATNATSGTVTLLRSGNVRIMAFDDAAIPSSGVITLNSALAAGDRPQILTTSALRAGQNKAISVWIRPNGTIGGAGGSAGEITNGELVWIV